jgi:DNA-directed RNA polymerase specialized sigma24 family protein
VSLALSRPASVPETAVPSPLAGLLAQLDTVYGFALTLVGDAELAADLTEQVYRGVPQDLWSTLGGHGLRERLLACCLAVYKQDFHTRRREPAADVDGHATSLIRLVHRLPTEERAAIALVDQLRLSHAAATAVLDLSADEFCVLLRRARAVLVEASRASAG